MGVPTGAKGFSKHMVQFGVASKPYQYSTSFSPLCHQAAVSTDCQSGALEVLEYTHNFYQLAHNHGRTNLVGGNGVKAGVFRLE